MKITDVEVYVVDPTQGASTYNDEPQNVWTFVRVLTDSGLHGWGESTNFPANGSLIIADAIRHLRPWIVGQDAADITAMWHRLFRKATYLGPRGLPTAVVSGIDIALWDIKGKVDRKARVRPPRRQGPRRRAALRERLVRRPRRAPRLHDARSTTRPPPGASWVGATPPSSSTRFTR